MLEIYNTLNQKPEFFESTHPDSVKMYTCGPSTYQAAHVGNYRTFLFEDILQRYLEYLGYKVIRLMTFTDIEDKAIEQAKKENLSVEELTKKNEAVFFKDSKWLRIKKPDFPVRASEAVDKAAELTSKLIDADYAYWIRYKGAKNAYFDPLKFKGFGKLAHLDMTKWPKGKRRFHKDTYTGTPWNMGDFIIWHGCGKDDVCYDTIVGKGRPAWNIQDAAIVTKYLGLTIDIACGGIDNLVRHHDYTLAIVESISGEQFSRYWLHGGHLLVNGKKMSKSVGNVVYPSDIVEKGFNGAELRFFLIYGAYREELNFTFEGLAEARQRLERMRCMIEDLQETKPTSHSEVKTATSKLASDFEAHMNNNLDIKGAFDSLHQKVEKISLHKPLSAKELENVMSDLRRVDTVLQCIF